MDDVTKTNEEMESTSADAESMVEVGRTSVDEEAAAGPDGWDEPCETTELDEVLMVYVTPSAGTGFIDVTIDTTPTLEVYGLASVPAEAGGASTSGAASALRRALAEVTMGAKTMARSPSMSAADANEEDEPDLMMRFHAEPPERMWLEEWLTKRLASYFGGNREKKAVIAQSHDPATVQSRLLGRLQGRLMFMSPESMHGFDERIHEDDEALALVNGTLHRPSMELGGLAGFIALTERALADSGYSAKRRTLVILGDLLDVEGPRTDASEDGRALIEAWRMGLSPGDFGGLVGRSEGLADRPPEGNSRPGGLADRPPEGNTRPGGLADRPPEGNTRPGGLADRPPEGNTRPGGLADRPPEGNTRPGGLADRPPEGNTRPGGLADRPPEGNTRPGGLADRPPEGNTRPGGLVDRPPEENSRPLDRTLGRESRSQVFARARCLVNALQAAREAIDRPAGEPVVDRLVVGDPTLSYLEVAYELRHDVGELLASQLPWLCADGPIEAATAEEGMVEAAQRSASKVAAHSSKELDRALESDIVHEHFPMLRTAAGIGWSFGLLTSDGITKVARSLDAFATELANDIEGQSEPRRRALHAALSRVVSIDESSCDVASLVEVVLRARHQPELRSRWAPGPRLLDAAHDVLQVMRDSCPSRASSLRHLHGLSVYVPAHANTPLPAEFLGMSILEDSAEAEGRNGWTRLLATLRQISAAPTIDSGRRAAKQRMHYDVASFWARHASAPPKRARRNPARVTAPTQWGLLLYLPGDGPDEVHARTRQDFIEAYRAYEDDEQLRHLRVAVQADFPSRGDEPAPGLVPGSSPLDLSKLDQGIRLTMGGRRSALRSERRPLEELDRIDSGSAETLKDFVRWGAKHCASHRLVLAVTGHATTAGNLEDAEWGDYSHPPFTLCHDHSEGTHLTLDAFTKALREVLDELGRERLDVLLLDVDGMMTLEAAHELRKVARHLIARPTAIGEENIDYQQLIEALNRSADPIRSKTMEDALTQATRSTRPWSERVQTLGASMRRLAVRAMTTTATGLASCDLERVETISRRVDVLCRELFAQLGRSVIWTSLSSMLDKEGSIHGLRAFCTKLGEDLQRWHEEREWIPDSTANKEELDALRPIIDASKRVLECLTGRDGWPDDLSVYWPMTVAEQNNEAYLALEFHQQVHLYALLSAARLIRENQQHPHRLWDIIATSVSHTSGNGRRELLTKLTGAFTTLDGSPTVAGASQRQFASLASPPSVTLSLEPLIDHTGSASTPQSNDASDHYRVRLAATTSAATLPQNVCRVNRRSIDEALEGLETMLDRMGASPAQWSYLQSLGDGLGEDIVHRLRNDLKALYEQVEADSPGGNVHLSLRVPQELMRYPWELMSDGQGMIGERFAVGRQIYTDDGSTKEERRHVDSALRVLIVGDPLLLSPMPRSAQLPGAKAEAEAVADLFQELAHELGPAMDFQRNRDVYIRTTLTRTAMRRLLREGRYDIVHFAGHGKFQPHHPERSAWILSDGPLWASELANTLAWSNAPWLVYANACEAGLSADARQYSGDVYGLASACINQGVGNYVAPLWPVGDTTAKAVAVSFYEELILQRSTIGSSLRRARLAAKATNEASPGTAGIFDISWASMVLYGDPSDRWLDALGGL